MNKGVTKKNQVKDYLIDNGRISSWDAIQMFGATRLSAIIFNLKKEGMNITTTNVTKKDRNGHSCTFAEYILEEN